jgi:hypothetical protein
MVCDNLHDLIVAVKMILAKAELGINRAVMARKMPAFFKEQAPFWPVDLLGGV